MSQVTGSFTAAGQTLVLATAAQLNINMHWSGTFTGCSLIFEGSPDNSNWSHIYCQSSANPSGSNYQTITFDSTVFPKSMWSVVKSTFAYFRARCAALTSGTIDLMIEGTGSSDSVDAVEIQGETQLNFAIGTSGAQAGSGVGSAGVYDFSSDVDCFLKIAAAAGTSSDVTTATGEPMYAGQVVPHRLAANDRPGAITASGSGTLRYIRVRS